MNDDETAVMLANDPFHKGLEEHGELKLFYLEPLTDDDIKASQLRLDKLMARAER